MKLAANYNRDFNFCRFPQTVAQGLALLEGCRFPQPSPRIGTTRGLQISAALTQDWHYLAGSQPLPTVRFNRPEQARRCWITPQP